MRGIKGVKDMLPDEMPRWQLIEDTARRLAEAYGYREIRIPIFEATELFARSIGASSDIVEKEMYTFQDRDGTSITLRPEGTAGVVRAFVEHHLDSTPSGQKLYYLGPMFRHERPQAGRFRQFHQLGVESFGVSDPRCDVEVIALLWQYFQELHLPDLTLEVNSLGELEDRAAYKRLLAEYLAPHAARLCSNCRRRLESNPLRVLDCKVPGCREVISGAPRLTDHLSSSARAHFDDVLSGLVALDIPWTLNPRLVRGLDYYTLTTFEMTSPHLGAQNAVGAGGRYDGLVEALGGPATPAVGFAVGLERVALLLPASRLPDEARVLYVAAFGKQGGPAGFRLLHELRRRGLRAEMDFRAVTLKSHLRQADRRTASHVLIVGDDEVARGSFVLRDMQTKQQEDLPSEGAAALLAARWPHPAR